MLLKESPNMSPLIAKPVVNNQFWIVTDGKEKVGNVIADSSGFAVSINGDTKHFKNTQSIQRIAHIEFQKIKSTNNTKKDLPFTVYPTTARVFNSILDIKRKLHLYTKTAKSKCFHAAGWFAIQQGSETVPIFCPKYIFIQRYPYAGPFKTEQEVKSMINT